MWFSVQHSLIKTWPHFKICTHKLNSNPNFGHGNKETNALFKVKCFSHKVNLIFTNIISYLVTNIQTQHFYLINNSYNYNINYDLIWVATAHIHNCMNIIMKNKNLDIAGTLCNSYVTEELLINFVT